MRPQPDISVTPGTSEEEADRASRELSGQIEQARQVLRAYRNIIGEASPMTTIVPGVPNQKFAAGSGQTQGELLVRSGH
jgi:hypothetical protein